jgi:hypothetical protein
MCWEEGLGEKLRDFVLLGKEEEASSAWGFRHFRPKTRPLSAAYEVS